MLRRKSPSTETSPADDSVSFPEATGAFVTGQALHGVHFYTAKEARYFAYATLHSMSLRDEVLTLNFSTEQVLIEGRGLHSLYVQLAGHNVSRVHEQGERYEAMHNGGTFIRRIRHHEESNDR